MRKNRIREFREKRGWSTYKLAEALGTSQPQAHRLENKDPRLLKQDWIDRIATALDVSPAELTDAKANPSAISSHPKELLHFLLAGLAAGRKFPEATKQMLDQHMTLILDYDAKHDGIKSPEKYVDMALAFLESTKKK